MRFSFLKQGLTTIPYLLCVIVIAGCNQSKHLKFDFQQEASGAIANGWSNHHFGEGVANWKIAEEGNNKVFAQLQNENPKPHFNIAVYDGLKTADVELFVKFRAIQGVLDQGGGFVWRYLDESNHYIVRANPLENNVVLYKMEKGERKNLQVEGAGETYGVDVPPMGNDWHTLSLKVLGNIFTVSLDGKELFKVKDYTFITPGKIGLWTKADAVTWFDDLQVSIQ